jgi:hypothetical protein
MGEHSMEFLAYSNWVTWPETEKAAYVAGAIDVLTTTVNDDYVTKFKDCLEKRPISSLELAKRVQKIVDANSQYHSCNPVGLLMVYLAEHCGYEFEDRGIGAASLSYSTWATWPAIDKAAYMAGAVDAVTTVINPVSDVIEYNACLNSNPLASLEIAKGVQRIADADPQFQSSSPVVPLVVYLAEYCGWYQETVGSRA